MRIEHLIEIKSKARKPKAKRKWPVDPSDRSKLLYRRKPSGIRFYDLGYMLVGDEYEEIPFLDPHSGEALDGLPDGTVPTDILDLSYYTHRADVVLDVPLEDWKTTYKRVTDTYIDFETLIVFHKGNGYNFAATDAWDGETFRPTDPPINDTFSVVATRHFEGFSLNNSTYKATTEFDYDAPTASFVPSNNMDVFLMPSLQHIRPSSRHSNLGAGSQTVDHLNYLRFIFPRVVVHDPLHSLYGRLNDTVRWLRGDPSDGTAAKYYSTHPLIRYWQSVANARAVRDVRVAGVSSFAPLNPADFADAGQYPDPPSTPPDAITLELAFHRSQEFAVAESLVAVIKQGSTYYYIWQTV